MTAPRQILPGNTYMVTRRCTQRQFLLRPSKPINAICRYCLAAAAQKYDIPLHAYIFMGDHYHLIVTDPEGQLPTFQHWLNEFLAKNINAFYGRGENVWAPGSYNAVAFDEVQEIASREDLLEKMVYVLTNPVAAGLVRFSSQWPGVWSSPQSIGKRVEGIVRPQVFFRHKGKTPAEVSLEVVPPPGLADEPVEAVRQEVSERTKQKEAEIQQEFEQKGRKFMGPKRVLAQSPRERAKRRERRRGLKPRVACRGTGRRVELLGRLKQFLRAYRRALEQFGEGMRDVVFPAGTYNMRIRYGVACHGPP